MAFDNAPEGMFIYSLARDHLGEILHVNDALCDLLHRGREELVSQHKKTLSPAADGPAADASIDDLLSGRRTTHTRDRVLVRADGREILTSQAISVVRPRYGAPYTIAQITDLTGRVEAEREVAEALEAQTHTVARLRELNEARVDAAARLAHDLLTPLTCVRAYQELLITGDAGELTDDQTQLLGIALRNVDKVVGLVEVLVTTAS